MVRLLLIGALLIVTAGCGSKEILDDPAALEAAAAKIEAQFGKDKEVGKFELPVEFNPGLARPEVTQAVALAASVKNDESDVFTEQIRIPRQSRELIQEYVCHVFGFWEQIKLLPDPDAFQKALVEKFFGSFAPPSEKFKAAVADLYAKLQTIHTDPLGFAITAVVKVCEIT
jgi:hypothetical protein